MLSVSSIENCHSINTYVHIKVLRIYNNIGYNRRIRKLRKATVQKMNALIWVIVAFKIFVVCWLIHMLLERRKRKRETQNVIIIEEGPAASYAGVPMTQLPKDCQEEFYNQQLYAANNVMPPPGMQQAFYSNQPPPPMAVVSPK